MADTLTPVGLIEQAEINNNLYNIASTAYAECSTGASTPTKEIALAGFSLKTGVTIHVKFINSNTASSPSLKINSAADAIPIKLYGTTAAGNVDDTTGWQAGAVLSLTYDGTNWIRDQGYNTDTTYVFDGTYNSSTNKAATVSTVTNAINALDVDNATSGTNSHITGFGAGKTLKTLTQTDGKIAATFQDIKIAQSAVTNLTTDLAAKAPINNPEFTGTVTLPGAPTLDLHAATKKYVDDAVSGLSGAMHFVGTATQEITDGGTQHPTTANTTYSGTAGDVVLYDGKEFVWTGTAWELLGDEGSYALDSNVVHKSDYNGKGKILYGTGTGTYNALAANTTTTKKVLIMASSTPSWSTLGINAGTGSFPTLNATITTEFLTASNAALTTGTAYAIPNVTKMATASVTNDAVLVIESGTMGDDISVTNITGIDKTKKAAAATAVSLTGGSWPSPSITYN